MENTEENVELNENVTITNEDNQVEDKNEEINEEQEPLFRVVLPKRRSWFYSFKYYIRGLKAIQAILGPQTKALPAPSKFRD